MTAIQEKITSLNKMLETKEQRVIVLQKKLEKIEKVLTESKYTTFKIKQNKILDIIGDYQ